MCNYSCKFYLIFLIKILNSNQVHQYFNSFVCVNNHNNDGDELHELHHDNGLHRKYGV